MNMSSYYIFIVGFLFSIMIYKRYFPVLGIPCKTNHQDNTSVMIVDLRDYNIGTRDNQSDMRIPYAYLKRFIQEIPKQQLHVIANDRLELHLGVRYLKSKGYQVGSYQISNCPCRRNKE